jgi:hypothetical protein
MSEQKYPMKDMTVKELRIILQNYKQAHCPPIPIKKDDLQKICKSFGLQTKKEIRKLTDPLYKPIIPIISDFTKKKLIEKIIALNKKKKEDYAKVTKKELTNILRNLVK